MSTEEKKKKKKNIRTYVAGKTGVENERLERGLYEGKGFSAGASLFGYIYPAYRGFWRTAVLFVFLGAFLSSFMSLLAPNNIVLRLLVQMFVQGYLLFPIARMEMNIILENVESEEKLIKRGGTYPLVAFPLVVLEISVFIYRNWDLIKNLTERR